MSRLGDVERRCQEVERAAAPYYCPDLPVSALDLARDFRVLGAALREAKEHLDSPDHGYVTLARQAILRALAVYDAWLNEETP